MRNSVTPPEQNRSNPVVLVHGFKDTSRKMQRMARYLRERGWTVHTVTLAPSWGQAGIDELARQLVSFIESNLEPEKKFDIVGFSMGGLVSRYFIQRLGGLERVQRFITISTPHRGTLLAGFWPGQGCREMRRNSDFLRELNAEIEMLRQIDFTSMWTPLDLMILPARSSCIGVGRDIKMWMPAHPLMVLHPRCLRRVAELLATG